VTIKDLALLLVGRSLGVGWSSTTSSRRAYSFAHDGSSSTIKFWCRYLYCTEHRLLLWIKVIVALSRHTPFESHDATSRVVTHHHLTSSSYVAETRRGCQRYERIQLITIGRPHGFFEAPAQSLIHSMSCFYRDRYLAPLSLCPQCPSLSASTKLIALIARVDADG
jgi:hypothetical protein